MDEYEKFLGDINQENQQDMYGEALEAQVRQAWDDAVDMSGVNLNKYSANDEEYRDRFSTIKAHFMTELNEDELVAETLTQKYLRAEETAKTCIVLDYAKSLCDPEYAKGDGKKNLMAMLHVDYDLEPDSEVMMLVDNLIPGEPLDFTSFEDFRYVVDAQSEIDTVTTERTEHNEALAQIMQEHNIEGQMRVQLLNHLLGIVGRSKPDQEELLSAAARETGLSDEVIKSVWNLYSA